MLVRVVLYLCGSLEKDKVIHLDKMMHFYYNSIVYFYISDMNSKWIKIFRLVRPMIHFVLILFVFRIAYKSRIRWNFLSKIFNETPWINTHELLIFALISAWIFVIIWLIKNLYELNKEWWNYIQTLSKVWVYRFICSAFISYFGQWFIFNFWISRYVILMSSLMAYILLFLIDQLRYFADFALQKKSWKKVLIISDNLNNSSALLDKLKWNFSLPTEAILSEDVNSIDMKKYSIAVVVGNVQQEILQQIFEKIRFYDTRFFHVSEGFFLEDVVYKPEKIWSIIAMEYTHSQLDWRALVWKRVFDIVVSLIALIIFAIPMLIIAIIIRLDSKWPAIYKSQRVWKWWKLFTFYKFRSMKTEMCVWYGGKKADELYEKLIASDANNRKWVLPKIKNDPRVTKVGKFIRKTSLDELPQLFQVLRGSMSLVWPRPHLPNEVAQYEQWERRVLSIKPWITGYAQVFGRDNLPFSEEAKLDLYYIQNRSLAMDLYVIFATFGVVFKWH